MQQTRSVLFVGHCYYNSWFLRNTLPDYNWKTKLINIDRSEKNQHFYWGNDGELPTSLIERMSLLCNSLIEYRIFHFSNRNGIYFLSTNVQCTKKNERAIRLIFFFSLLFLLKILPYQFKRFLLLGLTRISKYLFRKSIVTEEFANRLILFLSKGLPWNWDIYIVKAFGTKIVYTNNGCHDGVTPSTFNKWGDEKVCESVCQWYGTKVCTDFDAIVWGEFRNNFSDYQILLGGNRADFNLTNKAHEVPEFYCLDSMIWKPGLSIPEKYKVNSKQSTVKIFHSVGNFKDRTKNGVNVKCSHIYIPLIEELRSEGYDVEMIFCTDVPAKDVRFVMSQCDVVVDMLTFGWFGANIREAMMLGIPSVCFLRESWMNDASKEIPEYISELPVVNANLKNIKSVLIDLIMNKEKRVEIGKKSREFAIKWHSKEAGAAKFDEIYSSLIS